MPATTGTTGAPMAPIPVLVRASCRFRNHTMPNTPRTQITSRNTCSTQDDLCGFGGAVAAPAWPRCEGGEGFCPTALYSSFSIFGEYHPWVPEPMADIRKSEYLICSYCQMTKFVICKFNAKWFAE